MKRRTAILILTAIASGCATFGPPAPPPPRESPTSLKAVLVPETIRSIDALERELASLRTREVVIPASLLRKLVRSERNLQAQCHQLSDQLKALKEIDFSNTEEELR